MEKSDEYFMRAAIAEAKKALAHNEVPIGAVLVFEGEIIARAYNQVEMLQDASAHAEMLCLTIGAAALENWRLLKTTLYTTLEPCTMCAGALLLARVERLVWGARDIRQGACGSWINVFGQPHPLHSLKIDSGVLGEESGQLLKDFFRKKRLEKESS